MTRRSAILACGAVLLATLTGTSMFDARAHSPEFVALMICAGVAYVAALALVSRGPGSRRVLVVCLLLGVVWRLALVTSAPLVSDDVYRYVWDGRVQRHGFNPYETTPDDAAVQHLHTEVTRRIDPTSAELPTIYPPAAELLFRLVTTLHESTVAMIVVVVVCDLLIVLVLWRWLVMTGRDPWWVLAYAWHPLVALEGAGSGHIDLVGTLLVVTTVYALANRWSLLAAAALALSVAVKFLPIVLVPLLWRRVRLRDAAVASGLVGLAYLFFVRADAGAPIGSLRAYAERWRFNGPFFELLEPYLSPFGVLALAAVCGIAAAWRLRETTGLHDPRSWAWPLAAALFLMPAVYPWYLVWLTPFLVVRANWPLLAWTLTSPLTYVVWSSQLRGDGWVLPAWVVPVEYGIVAGIGFWVWWSPGTSARSATS